MSKGSFRTPSFSQPFGRARFWHRSLIRRIPHCTRNTHFRISVPVKPLGQPFGDCAAKELISDNLGEIVIAKATGRVGVGIPRGNLRFTRFA